MCSCAAIVFLAWWIAKGSPYLYPRPHFIAWDIVSLAKLTTGLKYAPGIQDLSDNILVGQFLFALKNFGPAWSAMLLAQLPYLLILLFSITYICKNLGGTIAGIIAPWIAFFAPITIGLTLAIDDLLMLQAMAALTAAACFFVDEKNLLWFSPLPALPVIYAVKADLWFSNGLLFVASMSFFCGGLILSKWLNWLFIGKDLGDKKPWAVTIGGIIGPVAGIAFSLPIPVSYLQTQAARPDFESISVFNNLAVALACPKVFALYMVGTGGACLVLVAIIFAIAGKKFFQILPFLFWLAGPMVLLTLISKRHDFYLVSAVPAAYPIIVLGITGLSKQRLGVIASILAIIVMSVGFFQATASDVDKDRVNSLSSLFEARPLPYLVGPDHTPFEYMDRFGKATATKCSGREIVFANPKDLDSWTAFYVWKNDRNAAINYPPANKLPAGEFCIVCRARTIHAAVSSEAALRKMAEDPPVNKYDGALATASRVQALKKRSEKYWELERQQDLVLFGLGSWR